MIGGGTVFSEATMPSNVVVRRNRFDFPQRYIDRGYELKNLSEFKVCDTGLFERNRLTKGRMTGYDGQNYSTPFKNVAQPNGATPGTDNFNRLRHITTRLNEWRDCESVFNVGGDQGVLNGSEKIDFSQNRAVYTDPTANVRTAPASVIQFDSNGASDATRQKDLRFHHNTLSAPRTNNPYRRFFLDVSDQTSPRAIGMQVFGNALVVEEPANASVGDATDFSGYFNRNAGGFNAAAAFASWTDAVNCLWQNNALVGPAGLGADKIAADIYYASQAAAGLTTNDYRPSGGSPLLTLDTDGGMVGCNHALLDAALAGV